MKYAVVTGGTKGIGKQIALDLLKRGFFVITNFSQDGEAAEKASLEFSKISKDFEVWPCDQSVIGSVYEFIDNIRLRAKTVDCIICNTGRTLRKQLTSITDSEWEAVFTVNVHSHFYIIRNLDDLLTSGSKIIFTGSILGELPHATSLAYGVTKSAVHALAKNLVKEYQGRNVTVNVIAPGFVETEWQSEKPKEIRDSINSKTALGRFATVEEISKGCMMLLENDFINGAVLAIDGGYNFK